MYSLCFLSENKCLINLRHFMLRILLKLDRMMSNIVGSTDCYMQECFCPLGSLCTVQVTSFVLRAAGCSMLFLPCSRDPDLIKRRQMECSALIYVYLSSLGYLRKKKKCEKKGKESWNQLQNIMDKSKSSHNTCENSPEHSVSCVLTFWFSASVTKLSR